MKKFFMRLMFAALLLTAGFANAQTHYNLQVGTGTATNSYLPDYIYYNYSYSQMLYTAGEVGIDGTIDTIAFQSSTASGQTRTLTIYMAEVSQTTMATQVSADQFQQVFSGSVSWNSGWTNIPLDTLFEYQDTGSLVIAVIDGTGSYVSSISFLGTSMSDTRSKYIYNDYNTYTLSTAMSYSQNFVPNIKLGISSYSSYCAQPSDVTISNIVSDEATISWTENGSSTTWEVIVSETPVTDFDNAASTTVYNTSYTVTGLSGNTLHYVYVRAVCDASSESGWTNAATFTSACIGSTQVPYTTGFEGLSTGDLPNCWQAIATGSSSSSTFPAAYVYSYNARTGSVYFELESSTGETEVAALPEMDNINTLQLDFYAACMSTNFVLEAGVIESGAFVPVDTVALTAGSGSWSNSYNLYTVYFNQYSGSGNRIALRVTASGSYTLMIDDLSVNEIPSCIPPTNFRVDSTGSDWAALGWNTTDGSNWEVLYSTSAFNPDSNDLMPESAMDNNITLTNLAAGVQYTAYVRTNCGGGDYSAWVGPITFAPGTYIMAATGSDTLYTCGATIYDCGGPDADYTHNNNSYLYIYPNDPTKVLSISGYSFTESSWDYLRITDLSNGDTLFLDNHTPNGQTIEPVIAYGGVELYFHSDGSTVYEGFQVFVSCTDMPTCFPPTNLSVDSTGGDWVALSWTDTMASTWEIVYDSVSFNPDNNDLTAETATDNNITLLNLSAGVQYTAYLRADCGGDYSTWVGPITFSPGTYIMAATGTDTLYTCGATIYDCGGPDGQYTTNNESYLYVYPSDPTKVLSISGYSNTEGSWDYLRITDLATGNVLFTDNTTPNGQTIDPVTTYGGVEIYFHSDGSIVYDGFQLFVSCAEPPSCLPVGNLHVSHVNVDSIIVAWTDDANSGADYLVEYRPSDSINWNSIIVNTDYAGIDQLDANTQYDIRVTVICGSDDSSIVSPIVTATTLGSAPVDALPFICTFEDATVNAYWTLANGTETNAWYIGGAVNNGGDSALYISNNDGTANAYSNSSESYVFAFVSLNLDASEYAYSYDWKSNGEDGYDFMRVALVPASVTLTPGSYSGFDSYDLPTGCIALDGGSELSENTTWTTQTGTITVPAGAYKLVFFWNNDYTMGDNPPAAIDNVQFAQLSCPTPTNLTATNIAADAITVTWTAGGDETSWLVSDGTNSYIATTNSYTFLNLTINTNYTISVRALCGGSDTSFAVSDTYRTLNGDPIDVFPFVCTFEDSTVNINWTIENGSQANAWFIGTAANNGGNNALYISSDNGTTNSYNTSSTSSVFAYVSMDIDSGEYVYSFDWRAYGEGSFDYIRAALVPASIELAAGNNTGWTTTGLPAGCIALDDGSKLNLSSTWNNQSGVVNVPTGLYKLTFYWRNDNSVGTTPPAAIDNVQFAANTCPKPTNLTAVADTANMTVSWTPGGSENTWIVSNGTTTVTVTDTFYTFTGLTPSTSYTITVVALCGAGDTSLQTVSAFSTSHLIIPTTLPYVCTFDGNEGAAWILENGSQTNAWYVDTAAHNGAADNYGLYISNDNGASNNYSNSSATSVFAYRTFNLPAGEYAYSFDWRAYGESSYDYLRVALVPTSVTLTAGNNTGWGTSTLPAGALAMDGGSKLNLSSSWMTQTGEVTVTAADSYNMVFFWRNDGSVGTNPPAAIDNVELRANTCPAVTNIDMTAAGTDFVTIDWTADASASAWQVQYDTTGFALGTGNIINTTSHPVTISNLDAMTAYDVYVRPVCGAGDTGSWRGVMVNTTFCDNADMVLIGDTANYDAYTATEMPISTYYNYSLVEIIVDSAELGGPFNIDAIEFYYYSSSALTGEDDIDIYIQPTSKVEFTDENDAVALDAANAVHVFHGSFENFVPGWNTVSFDTSYSYNGLGNLMILVKDNSGVWNSSRYFVSVECSGYKTLSYYDDDDDPDITDPSTFDGYNMEVFEERPFMHLVSCGAGCPKPNGLTYTALETFGSYQFNWVGSAATYEVAIKSATEGVWPAETQVTTNSYTVSGLQAATTYTFRVRSLCSDGLTSVWSTVSFTTDSLPCFAPTDLHVTASTLSSVTLDWTVVGEETAWRIYVWNTGTQPMTFDVTSHPATVAGLSQNTAYNAVVMALCGGLVESEPSDTVAFTTTECQPVTNVTTSNVTAHSVTVSWEGDAASYSIEYGLGDFEQGYGTTVDNITTTTYNITDLQEDRSYSVYVRAVCDGNNPSAWSQRVQFRTLLENAIDDVNGVNVTVYPNPTSDNATIALSGVTGEVTITIVDLSGRTWYAGSLACDGGCVHTVDVTGLAEGAYFVRVSGEGVNMVKKLVVK